MDKGWQGRKTISLRNEPEAVGALIWPSLARSIRNEVSRERGGGKSFNASYGGLPSQDTVKNEKKRCIGACVSPKNGYRKVDIFVFYGPVSQGLPEAEGPFYTGKLEVRPRLVPSFCQHSPAMLPKKILVTLLASAAAALLSLPPCRGESSVHHGVAYYPELWPSGDMARDVAEMKKLGLDVVRIGEFAWSRMEPEEGKISLAYFREVMDRLNAAGIKVVLCTPTATPPVWLTDGHPERCYVDAAGTTMVHGARQHASYDDPAVRAACLRIVEAMAAELGRHPALAAWQIDNEFKCHVSEDFNVSSVAKWHRWLEARYKTVEALNAAWGADIWSERYLSFEQVPAPRKTPFLHNASLQSAWYAFSRESIAEFLDAQCAAIRRHSSAPITHNFNPGFAVDFERMSRNLDFVSFDDYPSAANWAQMVIDCDLYRSAKPDRSFWVMETSCSHNGWLSNYEPPHPEGFLVAEAVACYGLGAKSFNYWLWRQQRTGCELPHSALFSSWYKPSVGYGEVAKVEEARRRLSSYLASTKPQAAEVAITWSDRGRYFLQTEPLGGNREYRVNFKDIVDQWHALALNAGLNRELRFEGASLAGLKLLVTPAMPYVSPEFRDRVKRFVEAGGVWICAPLTGARTGEHTVPTDAGLGLVDELAGVETVYTFPLSGSGSTGTALGYTTPLAGWCAALKAAGAETRVMGTIDSKTAAKGLGFLTERSLGKGKVVVLSTQPVGESGAKLLSALLRRYAAEAGVVQPYEVSQGTLVCPRQDEQGRVSCLVVNMNGAGGTIQVPKGATDALNGASVPEGTLRLAPYEYRAIRW